MSDDLEFTQRDVDEVIRSLSNLREDQANHAMPGPIDRRG